MVVYVGDGWPTLGDSNVEAIQARLARRAGGAPRLGAVAVGPLANRRVLAALTRGSGPLFEIADSQDAASAAVELVSEALKPAVAGVEVDFGPASSASIRARRARGRRRDDHRRGPRPRRAARARSRCAGATRGVCTRSSAMLEHLRSVGRGRRRAALGAARVEEIVLRGKGREAATDVALRAGLLTPWTGLRLPSSSSAAEYLPSRSRRASCDLSSAGDGVLLAGARHAEQPLGTLSAELDGNATSDDSTKCYRAAVSERPSG